MAERESTLVQAVTLRILADAAEPGERLSLLERTKRQARAARKAAGLCTTIYLIALAGHRAGGEFTRAIYMAEWEIPLRTAEREWAEIRSALGAEPEVLAQQLAGTFGARPDPNPAAALSVQASRVLLA